MDEILEVTVRFIALLERIGIEYLVGGSVASSLHGQPRSTQDVDIVADLRPEQVEPFVAALRGAYYFDAPTIRDAVQRRSSFNVIDLSSLLKLDVFVARDDTVTRRELQRRQPYMLEIDPPAEIFVASPEDTIVQKLHWYRLGDEVSERQWLDAAGVVKMRQDQLDLGYMRNVAEEMDVADLLDRLLAWDQPIF